MADVVVTRTHNAQNQITQRTVAGETRVLWVDDPFTDNNTVQWSVADLNTSRSDGTWSASSGQLQNDTVISETGAPNGNGSILLCDIASVTDFRLSCTVTLSGSAADAGVIFGATDEYNFFYHGYDRGNNRVCFYQVTGSAATGRTWTLRSSGGTINQAGYTGTMAVEVRSGSVNFSDQLSEWTGTVPVGKVGVWAGSGSASCKFDNFRLWAINDSYAAEGRWQATAGGVSISSGTLQFNRYSNSVESLAVRRGYRGGAEVVEVDMPLTDYVTPCVLLHYQDAENFMAVACYRVAGTGNALVTLERCVGGDHSQAAAGSAFAMASGDRVRCVIAGSPQTLTVYVNGTSRLSTGTIDDNWPRTRGGRCASQCRARAAVPLPRVLGWSAGLVGLGVLLSSGSNMSFDNFKVGYDNNSDGDIDDAGDDIQIDDSFASNAFSLTYDNNGNLTDDGILLFGYDAWNRLVKATRRLDALTTVATYGYDGMNRRTQKAVSNSGAEVRVGDGGNTTVHFYYDSQWRILETRNGSNQTTRQWVFGTQYVDEVLFMDVNGDPTASNDANPDVSTNGEGSESPADHRYFYQQDRNWNVVALTDYVAGGGGSNGAIVERYVYTSYGEPLVLKGVGGGTSELANTSLSSLVGNPFMHQGLPLDAEKGSFQNRHREYGPTIARPAQAVPSDSLATAPSPLFSRHNPVNVQAVNEHSQMSSDEVEPLSQICPCIGCTALTVFTSAPDPTGGPLNCSRAGRRSLAAAAGGVLGGLPGSCRQDDCLAGTGTCVTGPNGTNVLTSTFMNGRCQGFVEVWRTCTCATRPKPTSPPKPGPGPDALVSETPPGSTVRFSTPPLVPSTTAFGDRWERCATWRNNCLDGCNSFHGGCTAMCLRLFRGGGPQFDTCMNGCRELHRTCIDSCITGELICRRVIFRLLPP